MSASIEQLLGKLRETDLNRVVVRLSIPVSAGIFVRGQAKTALQILCDKHDIGSYKLFEARGLLGSTYTVVVRNISAKTALALCTDILELERINS